MNNTIFCMRIPEVGVLLHPKHPDPTMFTGTILFDKITCFPVQSICTEFLIKGILFDFSDTEEFWESEGLHMKMVEPMKKWKVNYSGEMIHQATGQRYDVTLEVL